MRIHTAVVGLIRSIVVVFAIGFAWPSFALAEEPPASSPTVQEEKAKPADSGEVQERAVPRKGEEGGFAPLQANPPPARQLAPKVMVPGVTGPTTGTLAPSQPAPSTGPTGPLPVVSGTFEPNYRYPWVVRLTGYGCGGVLIDPQWVLTAAHCVTPRIGFSGVTYSRTDPYTGAEQTDTRAPAAGVGNSPGVNPGVFIHPNYAPNPDHANDIALIKLAQPFTINSSLQTVGLPRMSRRPGIVGTLASMSHTGQPPTGQLATFRAPIPQGDYPPKIYITAIAANASLCQGDSGSGFVTVEYGRATVRGIASQANTTNCLTPNGEAVFTDVFTFRGWILQTMGKNDASLAGNTRVRWSGRMVRGKMIVACFNPYGNLEGPLNVVGVEEGVVCEPGQTQTVMCNLEKGQGSVKPMLVPTLSGLTVRTTMSSGASEVRTLPPSGTTASFFGLLPAGASREFTCQIGTSLTAATGAITGANMAVMSRGVEGEQPTEPIVEQPSPFDPSEEHKP